MSGAAVVTWDFTLRSDVEPGNDQMERILAVLKKSCRKWALQREVSEFGYDHYQDRFSLKERLRLAGVRNFWVNEELGEIHLSPTSNANRDNQFYVLKEDTRVAGPWTDEDIEIPRDLVGKRLYPWQQEVLDTPPDDRRVNIIVNQAGNIGKSFLTRWAGVNRLGRKIPATIEKAEDLMQWVMSFPKSRLYLVDIPRSVNQGNLRSLYAAIEEIKGGYAYDKRYHGKEEWFDPPAVWVFCNEAPNPLWLSRDRWVFWDVLNGQLVAVPR